MADYLDDELRRTADEGQRLWKLVSRYARLEIVDKSTFILSGLLLGGILVGLAVVAIFCLSMFLITLLQMWGMSEPLSYVVMAFILIVIGGIVFWKREKLVTRPLLKALMREFFAEEVEEETKIIENEKSSGNSDNQFSFHTQTPEAQ